MLRHIAGVYWAVIRWGFFLLYNHMAWTYDWVSWSVSLGHWRRWQVASIKHLGEIHAEDTILELAHGTANLQIDLAQAGLHAIGLDLSPFMGRIAKRKLARNALPMRLVRANAYAIPFPNDRFAAVVSTFPTEFFIHPRTLAEVRRVLKPGGRYVIVPNGELTLGGPLAAFVEWLYQVTGQRGPWPYDPLEALRKAGFVAQMITEHLPGSTATLIVAEKTGSA